MQATTLFKCLTDENRLTLMLLLARVDEACVCDLMQALEQDQPKTSRQLSDLRKCGLLADQRRGKWVYYRLSNDLPDWVLAILKQVSSGNPELIQQPLERLLSSVNKNQPCEG